MTYKLKECEDCQSFKKCRMRVCDTCYHKRVKAKATSPCSSCSKIRPLVSGTSCHTCYERNRRHALKLKAESDPVLAQKLKDKTHRQYLKSKEKGFYSSLSRRISSSLSAYKSRDPDCDLDVEWFVTNIVEQTCHYCGITEAIAKLITGTKLHVDRKVPALGYKKKNCVAACKACNSAKLHFWTEEETLQLGKLIFKFYKSRI